MAIAERCTRAPTSTVGGPDLAPSQENRNNKKKNMETSTEVPMDAVDRKKDTVSVHIAESVVTPATAGAASGLHLENENVDIAADFEVLGTATTAAAGPRNEKLGDQGHDTPGAGVEIRIPQETITRDATTSSAAVETVTSAPVDQGEIVQDTGLVPLKAPRQQDMQAKLLVDAAATGVPSDAFLSHRSKVRAVVFPRPHTHRARKKTVDPGGMGDLRPGPGQYDVGGSVGWGGCTGAALVAPKRYELYVDDEVFISRLAL